MVPCLVKIEHDIEDTCFRKQLKPYTLLQAKLQLQRLQEQMKVLTEERDTMANALEAKESQLLGLQAQVDLLRNHNSETEAWLTSM